MTAVLTENGMTRRQRSDLVFSQLLAERSTWVDHWRMLADWVKPRRYRAFVTDTNKGDRRNQNIIDSTATIALRTLQAGMHAGLSSPSRPWFKLTVPDPELAEYKPVQAWLDSVTKRMLTVFLKSNLYRALPTIYGDEGLFGTACMAVLDDTRDVFRCYPYPIGTYVLGVSNRGMVNTFGREYQMTVRQVVEEFGVVPGTNNIDWSHISQATQDAWVKGNYQQKVDVCWLVCPNDEADPRKFGAKYLPYASYYIEKQQADTNTFLREGGFNEFPILAPRWEAQAEDAYSSDCPGMTALGDIRALQIMTKKKAQAVAKKIDPALQGPSALKSQRVSILPGDVNYVDSLGTDKGLRPVHEVNLDIDHVRADIQDVRYLIQQVFFTPLFQMLSMLDAQGQNVQRTAREIEERHEEKLIALGPVVEGNKDELHEPLIDRCFEMCVRRGMIPPAPEELQGMDLKVEFLSILAQAQKLIGISNLERFNQELAPLLEMGIPLVKHKVNWGQMVDEFGEALSVHPKIIIPTDEAEAALEQEQQAIAQQQQAEQAAQLAKGTKDLGQADLSTDSPLSRMLENVAG